MDLLDRCLSTTREGVRACYYRHPHRYILHLENVSGRRLPIPDQKEDERDASHGLDPLHGREDVHYSGVSDGTKAVIYEPMELMERLAALVPRPRFNLTRFYGVLAPASKLRPLVVPDDKASIALTHPDCPERADTLETGIGNNYLKLTRGETDKGLIKPAAAFIPSNIRKDETVTQMHSDCPERMETLKTDSEKPDAKRGMKPKNYSWAQLLMRVFELDVLCCPRCGGRMRVLCAINSQPAIQKILACLGLPSRAPPVAPAKLNTDESHFYDLGG